MKIQNQIILVGFLTLSLVLTVSLQAQDTSIKESTDNMVPEAFLTQISIDLKEVKLLDALQEIADKGKFHLNYRVSIIPAHQKVSINLKNVPAIEALLKVLEQTNINFVITSSGQVVN